MRILDQTSKITFVKFCLILQTYAILSKRRTMFGIWHLFLWTNSLICLVSSTNLSVWSFYIVIAIGLTSCLSKHLLNLIS